MQEKAAWVSLQDQEAGTQECQALYFTTPASHCASLRVAEKEEGSETGTPWFLGT